MDPVDATTAKVRELGAFIRDQRKSAQLSLRNLASMAGVSNPYLSQIERGLRKPSAEILQAIAKALRISAETLYVKAGILEEREERDVPSAILADPRITERQKQALVQIYESFRAETQSRHDDGRVGDGDHSGRTGEPAGGRRSRSDRERSSTPASRRQVARGKSANRRER
jgi:transcriptional regulator with XRE-family HTH domain